MKALFTFALLGLSLLSFALNPSRTYKQRPEKYNMKYEEVKLSTIDKATLNVWKFSTTKPSSRCILILHNGEGNMAQYLRRVDKLKRFGDVVIFDYRGFGESSEFEIDDNMYIYPHFIQDTKAVLDYCQKTYGEGKTIVYGWGIGGGLALGVGYNHKAVNKIIADTPFLSMEDLETRFSSWDEPMEVPIAGFDKNHEPLTAIASKATTTKGILLIVGSNDQLFNAEDYSSLKKLQKKIIHKEIITIQNPDRKDNYRANKARYLEAIETFIDS